MSDATLSTRTIVEGLTDSKARPAKVKSVSRDTAAQPTGEPDTAGEPHWRKTFAFPAYSGLLEIV